MIDVWLVFCQLVPFAEVILLAALEYQRGGDPVHDEAGAIAVGMVEKKKTKPGTVLLQVAENITSIEDNDTGAAGEATFESSSNRNLDQLKTLGALKLYYKTIL